MPNHTTELDSKVRRAVSRAIFACNQAELARQLDATRQAVHQWAKDGVVPVRRVLELAPLIGLEPYQIRPDIYPEPERTE